jgi:hypothetical protein
MLRVVEVFVINDQHHLHDRYCVGTCFRSEEGISGNSSLKEKARIEFWLFCNLAPGAGLEPAAWWLTATRSTS